MPEGPEAHTTARKLSQRLPGLALVGVEILPKSKHVNMDKIPLPCVVKSVTAHGKRPIIVTDQGWISVFLAMTGSLTWEKGTHPRIIFTFQKFRQVGPLVITEGDPIYMYFNDIRPFGRVEYLATWDELNHHFSGFGHDLITSPIDLTTFRSVVKEAPSTWEICKFLLEPKYICSVGNYLKAEILYFSRIRPDRTLGTLTDEEISRLHHITHAVLSLSLQHGGLTISDFKHPDGGQGTYPRVVYMMDLDPLDNRVITGTFSDGRTTYWVPNVQQ